MAQLKLIGKRCRFEAVLNNTGAGSNAYFIHSETNHAVISTEVDVPTNESNQRLSSFDIVPGLAGVGISFRSSAFPDRYIRHSDNNIYIHSTHETVTNLTINEDCSWIPELGLANSTIGVSFRSVNYPSKYLYHDWNRKYTLELANVDSDVYKRRVTWIPHIVGISQVNGQWKLVYYNDNAVTSGEFTISTYEGVLIEKIKSSSKTETEAWGQTTDVKDVFEQAESTSVTQVSSNLWQKRVARTTGSTYTMVKGTPFFLWQWQMIAIASDGTYVSVNTNIYDQTTTSTPPQRYAGNWTEISF